MSTACVTVDRNTSMLFPLGLKDWRSEESMGMFCDRCGRDVESTGRLREQQRNRENQRNNVLPRSEDPSPPDDGATIKEHMVYRLKTTEGTLQYSGWKDADSQKQLRLTVGQ